MRNFAYRTSIERDFPFDAHYAVRNLAAEMPDPALRETFELIAARLEGDAKRIEELIKGEFNAPD